MPRATENCLNSSIRSSGRWGLLPGTDKRGDFGIPAMLNPSVLQVCWDSSSRRPFVQAMGRAVLQGGSLDVLQVGLHFLLQSGQGLPSRLREADPAVGQEAWKCP